MVRCVSKFDTENSGIEFTLVIQNTGNMELPDDTIPTVKIYITHKCSKKRCPIECTSGKWQLEDQFRVTENGISDTK